VLKDKIDWYVENQKMIDSLEEKVRKEQRLRMEAEDRISELLTGKKPIGGTKTTSKKLSGKASANRIAELEKQVQKLEGLLRSRHPDSVAALVQAAKPSFQESAEADSLRRQVRMLKEEIKSKDDEMLGKMRGLKQQHEAMKNLYEKRLANASASSHAASKARSRRGVTGARNNNNNQDDDRVLELENKLREQRTFFTKKLKAARGASNGLRSSASSSSVGVGEEKGTQTSSKIQKLVREDREELDIDGDGYLDEDLYSDDDDDSDAEAPRVVTATPKVLQKDRKTKRTSLSARKRLSVSLPKTPSTSAGHATTPKKKKKRTISSPSKRLLSGGRTTTSSPGRHSSSSSSKKTDAEEKTIAHMEKEVEKLRRKVERYQEEQLALRETKVRCETETDHARASTRKLEAQLSLLERERRQLHEENVSLQFEVNKAKNAPGYGEFQNLLSKVSLVERRQQDRENELQLAIEAMKSEFHLKEQRYRSQLEVKTSKREKKKKSKCVMCDV
jgi:centrosomal protein CEP162